MTASTTSIYELSRDGIINAALRKVGAIAKDTTGDTYDIANSIVLLNALIAKFQTLGMPLWKRSQYTLTFTSNVKTYTFGIGQTINIPFPLKIENIVLRKSGGAAQDVHQKARQDFNLLNTASTGYPVNFTYQPFINYGTMLFWPTPDATTAANSTAEITYTSPAYGYTSAGETPDFPQEWQLALIYGLANLLGPDYGLPLMDRQDIKKQAEEFLELAIDSGYENSSLYFQREMR